MTESVFQNKRNTAANWTSNNPTLAAGEMGLETDTNRIKFGDGSTAWNSLPYVGAGQSFQYGLYTLSADQTSNLSVDDHIEWDTVQGSLDDLSTGSGQEKGIITLPANKAYKVQFSMYCQATDQSSFSVQLYDRTNSVYIGKPLSALTATRTADNTCFNMPIGIMTSNQSIDIDTRIIWNSHDYITLVRDDEAWLLIEEYGGY